MTLLDSFHSFPFPPIRFPYYPPLVYSNYFLYSISKEKKGEEGEKGKKGGKGKEWKEGKEASAVLPMQLHFLCSSMS